jgi:hypothetical protein
MRKAKDIKGLGDIIEITAEVFGIEKCEACEQRRLALNRFFPFTKVQDVEELSEYEIGILDRMDKTRSLAKEDMEPFFDAYNRRFVRNKPNYIQSCQCPGLIKALKEKLDLLRKD